MHIAFDATAIPNNRAGAGIYIFNLVKALAGSDTQNHYSVFAKPAHLAEFGIDQKNVNFISVEAESTWRRMLWEQTKLPQQLRQIGADLLHSPHYTMPLSAPCPTVVTFHDMTFYLMPEVHSRGRLLFFRRMMRISARKAAALLAVSESTRQDMLRLLALAPDRVVVTPGAASAAFRPLPSSEVAEACARYNLTPGRYIFYVGVIEPRKNIPLLLEAYARGAQEWPGVPLILAGKKGWLYEDIFRRVKELGLENCPERLRFLGYVPEDDLVRLYNGARVFVYPSLYEGFGLPVLEAMKCGVPVITSNISSMPEVAGDAAITVAPHDADALQAALRRVLTDDALAADLAKRGPIRAQEFSWQRCARQTQEVYRTLTRGKSAVGSPSSQPSAQE